MKKITLTFLTTLIVSTSIFAQAPQAFKYQAVVRNAVGEVLVNQLLEIRISIHDATAGGTIVYQETFSKTTNQFGLVNLEIGNGDATIGTFAIIDWGNNSKFLEFEFDLDGGSNYISMGTSQLLSVPYAAFSSNGIKTMTEEERDTMQNPFVGMQIYNSSTNCLNYFSGSAWFETCGDCTPLPSQAWAGNDTVVMGGATTLELTGNTPDKGSGTWSILSGEGGSFEDNTNPSTIFTGLLQEIYTLQWTVATPCDTTYDEVSVGFFDIECSEAIIDLRDGKAYEVVLIGFQCWMAENLNVGELLYGIENQIDNDTIEKYCYNDNEDNCDEFGALYQWDEMMQYVTDPDNRGICPEGWHLPDDADWCELEQFVDATTDCEEEGYRGTDGGTKLKEGGSSGFDVLPAGYRNQEGDFEWVNFLSIIWTSNEAGGSEAWTRGFGVPFAQVGKGFYLKDFGLSVRCIKD